MNTPDIEIESEEAALQIHSDEEGDIEDNKYKKTLHKDKDDYETNLVLHYYRLYFSEKNKKLRMIMYAMPLVVIILFSTFVSNSSSNVIAFVAMVISIVFIGVSFWMLGWILEKDTGTQAMKDISNPIKEGSEGFFMTQYGTIFKFAFLVAVGLFLIYLNRAPASNN